MSGKKLLLIVLAIVGFTFASASRSEAGVSVGIGIGFPIGYPYGSPCYGYYPGYYPYGYAPYGYYRTGFYAPGWYWHCGHRVYYSRPYRHHRHYYRGY